MTSPAELTERVRFEQRAADAEGDRTGLFAEEFTTRAKRTYLRGGEPVLAKRLEGVQPVAFRIRRQIRALAMTSAWQAVHALTGEVYQILSVEPTPDRRWLDILAEVRHAEQG